MESLRNIFGRVKEITPLLDIMPDIIPQGLWLENFSLKKDDEKTLSVEVVCPHCKEKVKYGRLEIKKIERDFQFMNFVNLLCRKCNAHFELDLQKELNLFLPVLIVSHPPLLLP